MKFIMCSTLLLLLSTGPSHQKPTEDVVNPIEQLKDFIETKFSTITEIINSKFSNLESDLKKIKSFSIESSQCNSGIKSLMITSDEIIKNITFSYNNLLEVAHDILQDLNECQANNGGCDHNCSNTAGSFSCSCHPGYELGIDRKSCIDSAAAYGYHYDGSIIIPLRNATILTWEDSLRQCQDLGAQPFVPKTRQDFEIIKKAQADLGAERSLWVPASDAAQEGELKWWNGEDASGSEGLVWWDGIYLDDNTNSRDCVLGGSRGVFMYPCSDTHYPMVCVIEG